MIVKKVEIDGKEVKFAASARTPRLYRQLFNRDVITDMASLYKNFQDALKSRNVTNISELDPVTQLSLVDLEIFENLAYCMARQASSDVPDTADEWLDQFDTFDIYSVFPQLMELWANNQRGMSIPKKK